MTSNIQLYQGDCLEVMKNIPDNSVDLVLTDPPYQVTACKWDSIIPLEPMWKELKRITKPNSAIVLFGSQPFTSILVLSNLLMFKYTWVWEKSKASNFVHAKYQPLKAHEDVIVFSQLPAAQNTRHSMNYFPQKSTGKPYNKGLHRGGSEVLSSGCTGATISNITGDRNPRSVQYFRTAESEGKYHPTQKPIALMEYLIKTYSTEGDVVLDFTMGSGTTGVACVNINRDFIGIEMDEGYFKIASSRIEDAKLAKERIEGAR